VSTKTYNVGADKFCSAPQFLRTNFVQTPAFQGILAVNRPSWRCARQKVSIYFDNVGGLAEIGGQ
jgi:hypothetical protein